MTLAELRTDLADRIAYHERIGDGRVAGALAVVLAELDDITGIPPAPTTPEELLTLAEAARRLHVSPRWLRTARPPYVVELGPRTLRVSSRRLARFLKASPESPPCPLR